MCIQDRKDSEAARGEAWTDFQPATTETQFFPLPITSPFASRGQQGLTQESIMACLHALSLKHKQPS